MVEEKLVLRQKFISLIVSTKLIVLFVYQREDLSEREAVGTLKSC